MRSRIESQGDKAIEQQQLSDRVKIAQAGRAREGQFMDAESRAANIREGVNVGVQNANQFIQNSRMNMWGGIAGGLAGAISNPEFRGLFSRKTDSFGDAMRAQYLPGDS
jgi:hypothetical protein